MNEKFDLTKGNILTKLMFVALPIMGSSFMQMTYNLFDMFWLGRLGGVSVAASGTVGMYIWLSMGVVIVARSGAEIGVSQNMGQGNKDEAIRCAQNSIMLALILGLLYAAAMLIFHRQLIGFFNMEDELVTENAISYLLIMAIGIPFSFLSFTINGVFNGCGNSRLPFWINFSGIIMNLILDPIFIFVFGWGIKGAAISTIFAQIVVCMLFIYFLLFSKRKPLENLNLFGGIDRRLQKQILKWGTPMAIESLLFTILSMIITRWIAAWGSDAIAAQKISSQIESLSWLICGGYSTALLAFVGQNYGAKQFDRIEKGYRISIVAMGIYGVFITLLLFFGAETIMKIFISEASIIEIGARNLKILAFCQLLACLEYTTAGCFKGFGQTFPPSLVSVTCNALRVPLAYILSKTPLGLTGIFLAITIGASARGIVLFAWYNILSPLKKLKNAEVIA